MVGAVSAQGSDTGTLEGRVLNAEGDPVTDAEIDLVDLRLHTHVDDSGAFSFDYLPPGSYLLRIDSLTGGEKTQRFEIAAGEVTKIDVSLEIIPPRGRDCGDGLGCWARESARAGPNHHRP